MFYGGISCIIPFLSVHMRTLGLTLWHTIWVHVASGLICILIPLLVGPLAERRPSTPRRYLYKLCFTFSLLIAIFTYTALLAVPRVRRIPRQPLVDFDCSSPMTAVINLEKCANWETCSDVANAWSSNTRFRLSHCRYRNTKLEDSRPYPPDSPNPLHMCFRSISNTTNLCLVYDPHVRENSNLEFNSDLRLWQFTEYRNVSTKEFSFVDSDITASSLNVCNFVPANTGTIIKVNNKSHDSVFCRRSPAEDITGIKCLLSMYTDGKKPQCYDVVGDLSLTFWTYLGLRSAADAFLISALCLMEGISLRAIQAGPYHRGAYGRTRIWPSFALTVCPIIIGVLVDYFSDVAGTPDYSPAYFIFAACELIACSLIYALPLPVGGNTFRYDVSQDYTTRNYGDETGQKYHLSLELIVITIIAVLIGAAWGISQVFDPLLYENIGFNHLLLGTMQSIGFLCGVPFLWVSKNLIQNIGEANLVSAAFAFHAIHLAGLSFIEEWSHWWWASPFEAMKAFTIPILWLALVATVEHDSSSKGKRIAMHYILAVSHFGVGRIIGCSVGGLLGEYYSMSLSYRVMSGFCVFMAVFYLFLHHCYMKPRHRKIVAARCALLRQSINGSCLQLVEHMPVNGMIVPSRSN
ncbi:Major facilitator superfamily domain-containing protein 6, partial [Stegodyphus mimosarum]